MISTERDAPSSVRARHAAARVAPARGPGRLEYIRAAGERPPRARPQRRGSPGPIPNPAVKPAFAESTAARGCGRAGRRARGGRFSIRAGRRRRAGRAPREARRGIAPCGLLCVLGVSAIRWRLDVRLPDILRHLEGCAPEVDRRGVARTACAAGRGEIPFAPFLRYADVLAL